MLQVAALVELLVCWIAWTVAFVKPRKQAAGQKRAVVAPASKWELFWSLIGFALVWMWVRPQGMQKSWPALIVSMILGLLSVALVWAAAHRLGKQWRYVAAVSEDHELIHGTIRLGVYLRPVHTGLAC